MSALRQYAKHFKRMKAYKALCDNLDESVMKELRKAPDGQAVAAGVEFHITSKTTINYPDETKKAIEALRESAKEKGFANQTVTASFDAAIPKSTVKKLLAAAVAEYKKVFKVK